MFLTMFFFFLSFMMHSVTGQTLADCLWTSAGKHTGGRFIRPLNTRVCHIVFEAQNQTQTQVGVELQLDGREGESNL